MIKIIAWATALLLLTAVSGELALLSITLSYTSSAPSGWGKECCHEVFECFRFYPGVSVAVPTWEPVFTLKHSLGKMLTALNRWGWEIQPSALLIGVHIVSCFIFPQQVLGTVALFLEMRIWIAFPGTKCRLWSLEVKTLFLSVASSSSQKNQVEGLPLLF